MKLFVTSLLAGLVGGAIATLLISSSNAPRETSLEEERGITAPPLAAASADSPRELSERLDELSLRLSALETRPTEPSRSEALAATDSNLREELESLRADLEAALARLGAGQAGQPTEELVERVATAFETKKKEEQVAFASKYQSDRVARLDEDMAYLGEKLGLAGDQSERLRSALLAQYEREAEQLRLWQEGTSTELVEELKESDGELFDEELQGVLTEEQRSTFWEVVFSGGKGK